MIYNLYSIHDKVAQTWMSPALYRSKAEAMRAFEIVINNDNVELHYHPGDYELYHLGTWDSDTADIIVDYKEFLCNGKDVYNAETE